MRLAIISPPFIIKSYIIFSSRIHRYHRFHPSIISNSKDSPMVSKSLSFNLHLHPHHHHLLLSNPNPNLHFKKSFFPINLTKKCYLHPSMASSNSSHSQSISRYDDDDDSDPDPTITNDDLKPTPFDQRTFTGLEMAGLWVGLVVGVPSYYLAGSLVDLGMAWWQGIATVVAANIILLIPLVLIGAPGTKYGISFPVLARSSFGIRGAHIPTLLRALVGCGWYGIESWIGGEAIFLLLPRIIKESSLAEPLNWIGTSPLAFSCFILFWVLQLGTFWNGIEGIREFEKYSAPILTILTFSLLIWSCVKAGGFGHMLSMKSRLSNSEFWALFFPSLTANISFWATLALNIPDFTRYAKTQKDQIIGQSGLPIFMGLFTFVGLAVTSSTKIIFGEIISSPIQLLGRIGGIWTKILAILGISLATITTNVAANVVAPANALVNLSPSRFTFRSGAVVTALLGIAFQPWRLLHSSESFVYTWLVGYSALMGPIAGIILVDYYLIKSGELNLRDLYTLSSKGDYYYLGGYNLGAIGALIVGILPVIPGFLNKVGVLRSVPTAFVVIYNNAWFFSFFLAGFVHWITALVFKRESRQLLADPLLPNSEML